MSAGIAIRRFFRRLWKAESQVWVEGVEPVPVNWGAGTGSSWSGRGAGA